MSWGRQSGQQGPEVLASQAGRWPPGLEPGCPGGLWSPEPSRSELQGWWQWWAGEVWALGASLCSALPPGPFQDAAPRSGPPCHGASRRAQVAPSWPAIRRQVPLRSARGGALGGAHVVLAVVLTVVLTMVLPQWSSRGSACSGARGDVPGGSLEAVLVVVLPAMLTVVLTRQCSQQCSRGGAPEVVLAMVLVVLLPAMLPAVLAVLAVLLPVVLPAVLAVLVRRRSSRCCSQRCSRGCSRCASGAMLTVDPAETHLMRPGDTGQGRGHGDTTLT